MFITHNNKACRGRRRPNGYIYTLLHNLIRLIDQALFNSVPLNL